MQSPFLVISLLFLFILKVFFKIFHINVLFFVAFICIIKLMESFIMYTSFGKWFKTVEERIFNLEFFQYFLFLALTLETFFFFAWDIKFGIFDRVKIFFVRTLWLVLVWKGFCVVSAEPIETFLDVISVFVFFCTLLYIDLRSKLLNYKFLGLDTNFVSWSQIVLKLKLLGEYQIINKVKDDSDFSLLSFSRIQNSSVKDLNPSNSLSSQKRTIFGSFGRKIFQPLETGRNIISALATSGVVTGSFFQYTSARQEKDKEYREWSSQLSGIREKTSKYKEEVQDLREQINNFEASRPNPVSRLLHWVSRDSKVDSLKSLKSDCKFAYDSYVHHYLQQEAIKQGLQYNRDTKPFPFFDKLIEEQINGFYDLVKKEVLVELAQQNHEKFVNVTRTITVGLIVEGQTPDQLASDPEIRPFLQLDASNLTPGNLPSMVKCSYEESFTTSFLYFFF